MRFPLALLLLFAASAPAAAQVVLSEIHYHPVEEPTFNADGTPVLDLSDDIHEFVEIQNTGPAAVDLSGWTLAGGISYTFPGGTSVAAGGFKVIAKTPGRIESVYALAAGSVLGPYTGKLGNNSDTVRVKNAAGGVQDSVTYSGQFPWAASADALGAQDQFTGLTSSAYNFKGRSLQRVSVSWPSGDPANWLASPLTGPTPGAAQAVTRTIPKPVVVAQNYAQTTDGAVTVRASQPVTVNATFSPTSSPGALGAVTMEYFVDNVNSTTETKANVTMTELGGGAYTAAIPGQADKSIVRYRFKANRGTGLEVVSPRADDPQIQPIGASGAMEAWHGYFVTPVRTSANAIYDLQVSTANLTQMNTNITQNPKRATAGSAVGIPRDREILLAKGQTVTATTPLWNGTVYAIFATGGKLYDVQLRYHGSRFHRAASNHSFKLHFPEHQPFNAKSSWFVTGHGSEFVEATRINRLLALPASQMRSVDWYFNASALEVRREQGEYGNESLDDYHDLMQQLNPGSVKEARGELYKTVGNRDPSQNNVEGPYTRGDEAPLAANSGWTQLQRYEWTQNLQSNTWKGPKPIRDMLEGMWTVRGDTPATHSFQNNPATLANVKAWFTTNYDIDTTLTSMAMLMWMGVWDDQAHNQFFWRRANGKWVRLGWDYDLIMSSATGGIGSATQSFYSGEYGVNVFDGTNWWKDTFFKCFRGEFRRRLWELNNSFFDPANLTAEGLSVASTFSGTRGRQNYINSQLASAAVSEGITYPALGAYTKPARPVNAAPPAGSTVLGPANLTPSPYSHPASIPHASTKWEIRNSTGNYEDPVLSVTSPTSRTSYAIPFDQLIYGKTYYWRATYLDANGHPSVVSAETAFTWGTTSATAGNIVINEVLADNRTALPNGGTFPDYIELRNNSAGPISLAGYTLTDDPLLPAKYTLPAGTTLAAGGYLILHADNDATAPGLHTGFGLDSDGDQVILLNGNAIVDSVTFGPQAPDLAIGRIVNGTGGWQANQPTPGTANNPKTLGSVANLRINEWMANPAYGEDWFELYNTGPNPVALAGLYLSDTPASPAITAIPALSFINGRGYTRFWADGSGSSTGSHSNFKLNNSGESLVLTGTNGTTTLDTVTFSTQAKDVSEGRLPDGSTTTVSFNSQTASSGSFNWSPATIQISEAMAHTAPPFEDAIKLHNPTADAVSIAGWWLSDDIFNRSKYQFPAHTAIPAGGYLVVYENRMLAGAVPFSLNATGGEIVLSAVDGTGALTGIAAFVRFGAGPQNGSFGRTTATGLNASGGGAEFWPQTSPAFGQSNPSSVAAFRTGTGAPNSGAKTGPITINEIMYHPPDVASVDDTTNEFIELHNPTASVIDLGGWRLKGGSEFLFASGSTIAPGGFLLVAGFNPTTDTASLNTFRATYSLGAGVPVYGPYSEKLNNGTHDIEIAYPTSIDGSTGYVNVDKVGYRDLAPWPTTPDGGGFSLQRASSNVIGNTAANWTSNPPTPNAVNPGVVSTLGVATTSLTGGIIGSAYHAALEATGGSTSYSWTLINGSVPGLMLAGDGTFSGTPAAAGSFSLTVQVTDNLSATASKTLTLVVAYTGVTINTAATLAGGALDTAYSTALAAGGGTAPYTWSLTGGSLPAGVSLDSTGVLAGVPTVSGPFSFTAQASDSGGLNATKSFTLTIAALPLAITSTTPLPGGTYGSAYSQALTATGGTPPYAWSVSSGTLPGGLNLSGVGDLTGTLSAAGTFNFTARVTDGANASTTKTLALNVTALPLVIGTSTLPLAIHGEAYSQNLTASGGVAPYAWTLVSGALPAAFVLSDAGVISGSSLTSGTALFTVQVIDRMGTTTTQTLSLTAAATGPLDHYTWDYVPESAYSNVPFAVKLTARDSGERVVTTAAHGVNFTATGGNATTSPVLITELTDGDENQFELQNVTGSSADTTGWFVLVSDNPADINTVNDINWPLPAQLASGAILRVSELNTTSDGRRFFGGPINWTAGSGKAWIMLFDANNQLRDFVVTGWTSADLGTLSVQVDEIAVVPGIQWSGNGLAAGTRAPDGTVDGWQRTGSRDRQNATDWVWQHHAGNTPATTFGLTNPGLSLPWAPTTALLLTPSSALLNAGTCLGYLGIAQPGSNVMLTATDAGSISGNSAPFTVLSGSSTAADGIPDAWKTGNGFNPGGSVAALDPDGDGAGNLEEFMAGSDPQSAASRFTTTAITPPAAGAFIITWQGMAGKLYRLSTSPDLVNWTPLPALILATTTGNLSSTITTGNEARVFVRVEIAP